MLALHNPSSLRSQDPLARRGRSRQVSGAALARQASEERRVSSDNAPRTFFVRAVQSTEPQRQRSPFIGTHQPRPFAHALSSSESSIHTTHNHHPILNIASPVPVNANFLPPFIMRSASPSPPSSASMSPDYYDSPPSPPRSLEDQVHYAYAEDDIHLAKILLLRLKGIEVTSDDDPRIAAVQDEDFDFCFVPNGRLMDERNEKAILEMQAREIALLEERRRAERFRNCERKWTEEKRRMREERLAVLQRREKKRLQEEDKKRRAEEEERQRQAEHARRRAERERAAAIDIHKVPKRARGPKIVNYQPITPPSAQSHTKFVYDFPNYNPPKTSTPSSSASSSISHTTRRPVVHQPSFDDSGAVLFTDVLKSMQGPLFPPSHDDRRRTPALSKSRSRSKSHRRDASLLEALLVDIEYGAEERRKRKGKQRAQPLRKFQPCLACSTTSLSSSPISSSVSSSIPRTSSWLSFRGATSLSASSSTTDLTTPSSSPISSPKPSWFSASRQRSWIPDATSGTPARTPLRHSCVQHTQLTSIAFVDSPLYIDVPVPVKSTPLSYQGSQRSTSTVRAAKEGAGVLRRMSKFVELAKGLQTAYASAALFTASASYDGNSSGEELERAVREAVAGKEEASVLAVTQTPRRPSKRSKLRPAGYRVSRTDVATFLDPTLQLVSSAEDASSSSSASSSLARPETPKYIPLTSPFPPTETPRTVLPDPLPFPLYFKPVSSPCRSPFRFHALSELHTMYPSSAPSPAHRTGQVTWRIRSVGNPVHMRLKALHNVVRQCGMGWDGIARETALGGGRERVVGVAYEGLGRTALSRMVPA